MYAHIVRIYGSPSCEHPHARHYYYIIITGEKPHKRHFGAQKARRGIKTSMRGDIGGSTRKKSTFMPRLFPFLEKFPAMPSDENDK
jgi:hypothetical protein